MADVYTVLIALSGPMVYSTRARATHDAIAFTKRDGQTREVWKRVSVVEANPTVTADE